MHSIQKFINYIIYIYLFSNTFFYFFHFKLSIFFMLQLSLATIFCNGTYFIYFLEMWVYKERLYDQIIASANIILGNIILVCLGYLLILHSWLIINNYTLYEYIQIKNKVFFNLNFLSFFLFLSFFFLGGEKEWKKTRRLNIFWYLFK